jgi:hypothetical protein
MVTLLWLAVQEPYTTPEDTKFAKKEKMILKFERFSGPLSALRALRAPLLRRSVLVRLLDCVIPVRTAGIQANMDVSGRILRNWMPAIHARHDEALPFSSSVGERPIMNHFGVRGLGHTTNLYRQLILGLYT